MISQNNQKILEVSREYQCYKTYLSTLDIKDETKEWRLEHIRGLIYYISKKEILWNSLTPDIVYDYMETISNLSPRTRESRAQCIRLFLNYLFENRMIKFSGTKVFPKIISTKYSSVESHYSKQEIQKVLDSVNTNEYLGKRNYAILLIFIYYGIRSKDVQCLTFENIKWNENKIIITQNKDNEINEFPMTPEIRYALLDYWKNERQQCKNPIFFLSKQGNKMNASGYYQIVNKYFKLANIAPKWRHHGPHSLRASLATSLLEDEVDIREITSILGHNQIDTTKLYARIDFKQLKKISLEVPEWKL